MTDQDKVAAAMPDGPMMQAAPRLTGLAVAFDGAAFRVEAIDASGRGQVSLGPYQDEEVVAVWRSLAAASGLPLMVAAPDGTYSQPYPQLGRIVLGASPEMRRTVVLSGRRPRFLVRRKPARLANQPLVYREKEIFRGRAR